MNFLKDIYLIAYVVLSYQNCIFEIVKSSPNIWYKKFHILFTFS